MSDNWPWIVQVVMELDLEGNPRWLTVQSGQHPGGFPTEEDATKWAEGRGDPNFRVVQANTVDLEATFAGSPVFDYVEAPPEDGAG